MNDKGARFNFSLLHLFLKAQDRPDACKEGNGRLFIFGRPFFHKPAILLQCRLLENYVTAYSSVYTNANNFLADKRFFKLRPEPKHWSTKLRYNYQQIAVAMIELLTRPFESGTERLGVRFPTKTFLLLGSTVP